MKRALALLVGGVLILGSALAAHAQAPTVRFGGQMRIYGFATDNLSDFKDSDGTGPNRDSQSLFFQRWRLFTTVESADKKAKADWALEVGDITWGSAVAPTRTAPSAAPARRHQRDWARATVPRGRLRVRRPHDATVTNPGSTTRTGNSAGGCTGADGVNVETKNIYLWLDTGDWAAGTSTSSVSAYMVFMNGPLGAFADDDAAGIILNWKGEMVDVQAWTAKLGEGNTANADDTDAYALRVGVNVTKEIRVTLEGLYPERAVHAWPGLRRHLLDRCHRVGPRSAMSSSMARSSTASGRISPRRVQAADQRAKRAGFGAFVLARIPIGPLTVNALGWYTEGDQNRPPGGGAQGAGSNTVRLTADSDKLPMPWQGGGWFNGGGAYMGEWMLGLSTIGNPGPGGVAGQTFGDPTGTYGVGSSVIYALTPALSIGGGGAYIGASDQGGIWGDYVIELDAGLTYRFNPNVTFNLFAGYMFPDSGDDAWGAAFRTVFSSSLT